MSAVISKSKFKAHALEVFRQVELTGQPVIVTDHGTPVVVVRKYAARQGGARAHLNGSVLSYHAPFEPVANEAWEALL